MKILITCPRAPVAVEWARIAMQSGHSVTFADPFRVPLGRYMMGTSFVRVSSPRFSFATYEKEIRVLVAAHDLTIPTCEDIFYLTRAVHGSGLEERVFAPQPDLLSVLHDKYEVRKYLNNTVRFPKTTLLTSKDQIDLTNTASVLKPVFSRFGTQVIRTISQESIKELQISERSPWVQQERIEGEYICNYAIIENGEMVHHVVYTPRYLVNDAAATFFELRQNSTCEAFTKQFAKDHAYTGQVAFDFIENKDGLYVIECNPRATSGLHLIAEQIMITPNGFEVKDAEPYTTCRVGQSIVFMFGLSAMRTGRFLELVHDYKNARDVIKMLSLYKRLLATLELFVRALRQRVTLAEAASYDIQYNNEDIK